MKFRVWLADLIVEGRITESSANKDLLHVVATIKDVARASDIPLKFNSERLMFKQGKANTRPPFSRPWISDTLLAPGALDGLNAEARCIMLGMINTGYTIHRVETAVWQHAGQTPPETDSVFGSPRRSRSSANSAYIPSGSRTEPDQQDRTHGNDTHHRALRDISCPYDAPCQKS
jgi:hypothetical protein